MTKYTIDQLNNMQLEELIKLEDETFAYFKKIRAVRKFTEELEKED